MKKLVSAMLVGATALLVGGGAMAEDMTEPGMNCDGGVHNTSGQREWSSTTAGNIICPIGRFNASTIGDITGIYVRVSDQSATDYIACQANSCNSLGTSCFPSDFDSTEPASFEGNDSLFLNTMVHQAAGYAYIGCNIPAHDGGAVRSKVLSYRYND